MYTKFIFKKGINQMELDDRSKQIEELRAAGKLVFCTACGEPNSSDDAFCGKCGARIVASQNAQPQQAYQDTQVQNYQNPQGYQDAQGQYQGAYNYQSQNQYQSDYSGAGYAGAAGAGYNGANYGNANAYGANAGEVDPVVLQMVRDNLEYYEPKFRLMKATNKKTSWNWPAFLVPSYWLFYRRMYLYGIIFLVGSSILASITMGVLALAANVAVGIFGNYIYMNFLEKNLADANNLQEPYRSQNINSHTGANPTAVWIYVGITFGLGLLVLLALGGLSALMWSLY